MAKIKLPFALDRNGDTPVTDADAIDITMDGETKNLGDVVRQGGGGGGASSADKVSFDPDSTPFDGENVQAVIEEIGDGVALCTDEPGTDGTIDGQLQRHQNDGLHNINPKTKAANVSFEKGSTGMSAETTQEAIEELNDVVKQNKNGLSTLKNRFDAMDEALNEVVDDDNVLTTDAVTQIVANAGNVSMMQSSNTDDADFEIGDENGYILAKFMNGHFLTKYFNSVGTQWLANVLTCQYDGKLMHISFDDTGAALTTLFTNKPTSIFDSTFFSSLKTLHDEFGACFSCYVYVETLENVTSDYADELQDAKDWLKWNFHTLNDTKYGSADIADDYALGITRLLTLCGSEDCLDHAIRGNYWQMSLDNAKTIRDYSAHKSFIMFGNDKFSTSTSNYYLDDEQTSLLFNNGRYYDTYNQIIFVQTAARLDTDDYIATSKTRILSNPKLQKMCEVLNHQWAFDETKMRSWLTWAVSNGFSFGFVDNVFNI